MKKEYSKPQIVIEDFMFNTNLAANCERIHNATPGVCGIPDSFGLGTNIFDTDAPGSNCIIPGKSDAQYDGFCYHVPDGALQLFNS